MSTQTFKNVLRARLVLVTILATLRRRSITGTARLNFPIGKLGMEKHVSAAQYNSARPKVQVKKAPLVPL